jgi:hypothetical protein
MDDAIYVGSYWGSRREDAEECAARLRKCLKALAGVSPVFTHWRPKGRSAAEAVAADEVVASQLAELLRRGVNRRDMGGTPIEELGYSWSAWNGLSKSPAAVSTTCGATSPAILNAFVLEFPRPTDQGARDLYERSTVIEVVSTLGSAWDASFTVATSHGLRAARHWGPRQPVVGWVTHLAPDRPVPSAVPGTHVIASANGSVVAIGRDWEDIRVEDIDSTLGALERGGALSPIP